ncbi:MAG TPA: TonB-dependent receptor [Pyrinomonadaceae bacterium]|jgi:hypothetical protein
MKHRKLSLVVLTFALFIACAPVAFSQSDRGSLRGTVTDPGGGLVTNAKVTVTNLDSGEVRETTTSEEGSFNLPELKAAPYKLTVEAAGFKTATIDNIQVAVQVTRRADITLEVGQIGEVVTVTQEATLLQTENAVQQTNVTERQVKELPLAIGAEAAGRSPLSFIFLDSSVTPTGSGSTGTNGANFRVNGGQGLGTDILIDGAATRRAENGTFFSEVAPGPNAFQEFTLSTSNYSAEFGNSSGGVVNFTIKSGGNEFHGEGYEYLRNEALNANIDVNRLRGIERPRNRQHDFGFNIGGPVYLPRFGEGGKNYVSLKDSTFFFFNYGGYRLQQTEIVDITVPTLKMRRGDFSELLTDPCVTSFFPATSLRGVNFNYAGIQIFDPNTPAFNRTPIPGNRLDLYQNGAAIDPVGQAIANLFPAPTSEGVCRNYRAVSSAPENTNYYVGKITHIISERQQVNFSYTYRHLVSAKGSRGDLTRFPRFPEPFVAAFRFRQEFKSYYARLQHDFTFTPNLLNHFNAGFSRTFVQNRNYTRGLNASSLGLPVNSTQNLGLPLIEFPCCGGGQNPEGSRDPRAYQSGGSTEFDNQDGDNAVQFNDFITYVRGRHTFKFGGELRFQQLNDSNHFDIGGRFSFFPNQTANTFEGLDSGKEGHPIASLLTGAPEFSFNSVQAIDPGFRFFSPSFFFQDDFKITQRLTLNLGIRYDINYPRVESHDRYRAFDPTKPNPEAGGRLGAIAGAAGQGGVQADYRGLVRPDYSNFGPRFGFAYSVNNQTVVRGGYGLYYSPLLYNDFGRGGTIGYDAAPNAFERANRDLNAFVRLRNYPAIPTINPNSQQIGNDVNYFDRDYKLGRTVQYSLEVQRELPANFAISVSYIGSKGSRLRSRLDPINKLPLEALKLGNDLLRRPLSEALNDPLAVAFAQSVGVRLPSSTNAVFQGFNGTVAASLRPYPQYNFINNRLESQGQSSYNALKVELQRRFAQGFQLGLSYTFSKLITDAAEDLFGDTPLNDVLQNPYDRRSLRSISPNSIPHSLVINYIFELPFGRGKRFLNRGGALDRLVGGFQVSGIMRYRSGPALVPRLEGSGREFLDLFGVPGQLRPNLTGQPFYTGDPATGQFYQYLNPAAFAAPPRYQDAPAFALEPVPGTRVLNPAYAAFYSNPLRFFGTAPPTLNELRGQPFYTEDLSLLKKTHLSETVFIELRAEFFNLFNRGRFALPDVNIDPNNFRNLGVSGRIGDLNQPRRIQIGARLIF